jgi:hypothetical protein
MYICSVIDSLSSPLMHARSPSQRRSGTSGRTAQPRRTREPRQLTLDDARRPTGRGGWRPGAGRRRSPGSVSHRARAAFAPRFPQHVAVVELNILSNRIHMLVEAEGAAALSRGMRGLGGRLARRINAHLGRSGRVFERYHARSLSTPREVYNALRYVLLNARHHAAGSRAPPRPRLDRSVLDRTLVRRLRRLTSPRRHSAAFATRRSACPRRPAVTVTVTVMVMVTVTVTVM